MCAIHLNDGDARAWALRPMMQALGGRFALFAAPLAAPLAALLAALPAALLVTLTGCAPHVAPPPVPHAERPAEFPDAYYRQAAAAGRQVLSIDARQSLLVVEVRRSGALAHLGHDHVVASHDVQGYVDADAGRADIFVPLDRLSVDEPELRAAARLETQPSADAIAGTRRNMLERVLEAAAHPFASIRVDASADAALLEVALTLHGTTRHYRVPARIERGTGRMRISGEMRLRQSDFGMTPMSVLGGALRVEDEVLLRFSISAAASGSADRGNSPQRD